MAKAMTGTFTISQTQEITTAGYVTTAIPIGSLIDVGDAQALEIESVDYIYQSFNGTTALFSPVGDGFPFSSAASWGSQLMDRNTGTMISAADNNLISSGAMSKDADEGLYHGSDFYPDDFQRNAGRFVVNDELYLVSKVNSGTFAEKLRCTVRIRAKVVKLSTRDWMAISLETVQNE